MTEYWRGKLVRLRAIEPDDAEFYFRLNMQRNVDRNQDQIYPPSSLFRQRGWAEESAKQGFKEDGGFRFQIEVIDSEQLAGCIDTHHCDQRTGVFSYGIALDECFRGKGYAKEAVLMVLRYYFLELRYQKCDVGVFDFNESSTHLHERLGFVLEGRRRRSTYSGGEFHDMLLFGMTVEEFRELHPEYVNL